MTEKGNEFEMIANILWVTILGSGESQIMTKCDLDRKLLEKYLTTALVLKLLNVERKDENFYRITGKGVEFLRFYHGLHWLLWGEDFDSMLVGILAKLKTKRNPYYIT